MAEEVIDNGETSVNDMIDLFSNDDDITENEETVITDIEAGNEGNKPEEKESEEEEEKEEKTSDEDEEEKEPDIFQDIPSRKEILKAFPDLFKKFPGIASAIYRDRQYTEIFPSIDDARQASESLKDFEHFEQSLLSGDLNVVLESLKESDKAAFGKVTSNILATIQKVDEPAYYNVLSNVIKGAASTMFAEGQRINNDNLKGAAQILHQF